MKVSREDLIYAAGFFDGEGSIGIYEMGSSPKKRQTAHLALVMNVTGTSQSIIMWWKNTFGGRIARVCNSHRDVRRADSWKWCCDAKMAREVLELLVPYLKLKKVEAEIALEFQRHKDSYPAWSHRNSKGRNTKLPDNVVQFRRELADKLKAQKRSYKESWW